MKSSTGTNEENGISGLADKTTKAPRTAKATKAPKAPILQTPIEFVLELCSASCLIDTFSQVIQNELAVLILEFGFKGKVEATDVSVEVGVTNDECFSCILDLERRNLQSESNLLQNLLSVKISFRDDSKKNKFDSFQVIRNLDAKKQEMNTRLSDMSIIINDVHAASSEPSQHPSISTVPSSTPTSIPSLSPSLQPSSEPSSAPSTCRDEPGWIVGGPTSNTYSMWTCMDVENSESPEELCATIDALHDQTYEQKRVRCLFCYHFICYAFSSRSQTNLFYVHFLDF